MRKYVISSLVLFIAFFAASAYALFVLSPQIVQAQLLTKLETLGISAAALPSPEIRYGALRYSDISLDSEEFSTIKTLDLRYRPVKLLLFKKIDSLKISGLSMTGEISEDGILSISGWETMPIALSAQEFALDKIDIADARLSLLTPFLGGISFNYDLQITKRGKDLELQGRINSAQKRLSLTSGLTGHVTAQGLWQTEFTIDQGSIELDQIKASRMISTLKISGAQNKPPEFFASFTAGGLSLYDLPWQNASGSIEGDLFRYSALIDAKSTGNDNLEISLNLQKESGAPHQISGALHAQNMGALLTYIRRQNLLPNSTEIMPSFAETTNIEAEFSLESPTKDQEKKVIYNLKNTEKNIDINGEINVKDLKSYTGTISGAPIFLSALDSALFSAGKIMLAGDFKRENDALSGTLKANITDAAYQAGPATIKNISGALLFNDLSALTTTDTQSFNCALPLKTDHKCTLNLSVKNGALDFKNLSAKIFDGALGIDNINPLQNNEKWQINVKDLNLLKLSQDMKIKGVTGTGLLKGTIPIIKKQGRLFIQNAALNSQSSGTLRYLYSDPPTFFEGDELELETINMALKNYHYDDLEIRLNGPLDGDVDINIIGRGQNPDLFGARKISLNLKTTAKLAPLFKNLIQTE